MKCTTMSFTIAEPTSGNHMFLDGKRCGSLNELFDKFKDYASGRSETFLVTKLEEEEEYDENEVFVSRSMTENVIGRVTKYPDGFTEVVLSFGGN